MKKSEQLRIEANKLETKIKHLLSEFIEDNGDCDIKIETDIGYIIAPTTKERKLTNIDVSVFVTV